MVWDIIGLVVIIVALMVLLAAFAHWIDVNQRDLVRADQLYRQLDTDFRHYREAAITVLDDALQEVDRAQRAVLAQHQLGHAARLEMIRIAIEENQQRH